MSAMGSAVCLLYHDVYADVPASSGFEGAAADRYKLSRAQFAGHLETIAGATVHPATAVTQAIGPATFHMSFDDGGASSPLIADLLEARQWVGHFFIPTDYIGQPGFLDADGIRALHRRGHVIGSHSASHPDAMADLDDRKLDQEWEASSAILADVLGEPVVTGSVPCGSYSPRVAVAAAKAGIGILFTSEPTATPWRVGDCLVLGRFSLVDSSTAAQAAALARADAGAVGAQYVAWNAKRAIRRAVGPFWHKARAHLLARGRRN